MCRFQHTLLLSNVYILAFLAKFTRVLQAKEHHPKRNATPTGPSELHPTSPIPITARRQRSIHARASHYRPHRRAELMPYLTVCPLAASCPLLEPLPVLMPTPLARSSSSVAISWAKRHACRDRPTNSEIISTRRTLDKLG